jgi:hypothetical protein
MSPRRTLIALAAVSVIAPAGIALAATGADDASAFGPSIEARLGGRTVAADMKLAARKARAEKRAQARRRAKREQAQLASYPAILHKIAACESGNNPRAVGGGGTYRGLFQFAQGTWNAVGGTGDPAAASVAEQYKRAAILLARSGPGQWPVCSR